MALLDILNDFLHGRGSSSPRLQGGLMFQFKEKDEVNPNRLLCYRIGITPSGNEIKTVLDHLAKLLPTNTWIVRRNEMVLYVGSDELQRYGYVIEWKTAVIQQTSLLDAPSPSAAAGAYQEQE